LFFIFFDVSFFVCLEPIVHEPYVEHGLLPERHALKKKLKKLKTMKDVIQLESTADSEKLTKSKYVEEEAQEEHVSTKPSTKNKTKQKYQIIKQNNQQII
jgi:hypothetical protein